MPKRNIIFTAFPFAKSDIHLGSLIPSRSRPDTDAFTPITPSPSDISCNEDDAFADSWNSQSSAAFTATLSKLFSTSLSHKPSTKIEIIAAPDSDGLKSLVYTLKNQRELFKSLCKLETVHEWLEEGSRMGEKAWLVVEYRSLVNACVILSDAESSGVSGKARLPVSEAAAGPVMGGLADVAVEGKYKTSSEKKTSFLAKEERVFAVGCRRVRLHRWSKNDPTLDKEIRWKSALTRTETRGQAEEAMIMAALDEEDVDDDGEDSDVEQRISLGDEIFLKLS
ncbi:hypothetical protein L207DRAFT_516011 [Hyaloscypha variabilis F]|uniref:Uncharacterized protein n=1 Tax=Hyaloscypha variabilis (strain UAMH 11265 / GT02V1 / F) TaxID=1149755 RepID=A0A2J6RCR7_HYAVF|nr:hypothetical protein L207DRAFT_516011 [Hyaloscypha variabilis F]